MAQKPRIPTAESIRQSMDDLRGGKLSEVEYETRQEVLALAQARVEAVLSDEVRVLFAQYSPQIIEAYGLLLRWQAERDGYPQSVDGEGEEQTSLGQVQPEAQVPRRAYSASEGGTGITFEADTDEEQRVLDALFGGTAAEDDEVAAPQKQDTIQDAFQSAANVLTVLHQQSQATHQPTVTFQAGQKMTLDTFQGAYKGIVMVREGKGKKATPTPKVLAVHKEVYEAEAIR